MSARVINIEYSQVEKNKLVVLNAIKMLIERKNIENKEYNVDDYNIEPDVYEIKGLDGGSHVIKVAPIKITSLQKNTDLVEFLELQKDKHVILIVFEIDPKQQKTLILKHADVEVFLENELMINVTDHVLVPKHILLTKEERDEFFESYKMKKNQMEFMLRSDRIARHYRAKIGDVFRIIRNSEMAGKSFAYRLVVKKSQALFK
jgi:DNA-directed RNA polymerase I, II, and III subunit RPABC1